MQAVAVWAIAVVACALLVRSRAWLLAAIVIASTAAGHALWATRARAAARSAAALAATLPRTVGDGGYASSNACGACHPSQYASWHRSYHRTMTQPANSSTVLAPFAGETLRDDAGRAYRLYRRGDEIWTDVDGLGARRIALVTGSHHMQAFWLPGSHGNAQLEFPFTWLLDEKRWVGRRDVFLVGREYDKQPSMWNKICVECHVTNGQPGFDARVVTPDSRAAELGIACEACHGPGAAHAAANRSPLRRFSLERRAGADGTIVNPARLDADHASQICGQCHGIGCPPDGWRQRGIGFHPGTSLAAVKPIIRVATLAQSACKSEIDDGFIAARYWKDGMVRVSGREYNALLDSPCRGMSCLDCHSMHDSDPNWQLAAGVGGACTQCHPSVGVAHTHHAAGSPGADCYNCHMPHTTYGLLRAMRSHQVSWPRVGDTLATGRPNACNLCHVDKTLAWTAATLHAWYGQPIPPLPDEQRTLAATLVDAARGEAGVRALAAWTMGWDAAVGRGRWMAPVLIELLDDEYSAIRRIAFQSLRKISGFADFEYDWLAPEDARWAAQQKARVRLGPYARGELEKLMAERREDDEMFLAE